MYRVKHKISDKKKVNNLQIFPNHIKQKNPRKDSSKYSIYRYCVRRWTPVLYWKKSMRDMLSQSFYVHNWISH